LEATPTGGRNELSADVPSVTWSLGSDCSPRRNRTLDLPIRVGMLGVGLDGSGRI
jgi:hypothetical protein